MKLLAVISHKGGVGKTTSAVLLAEELAAQGYRTLLVDADRQQGAGLLLEVGSPTGEVQRTRMAGLDYLGSARLTEAQVAQRAAVVADQYDMGIVDTPSLDDSMARAWLQQATAALMILQVEPLTVKTFPNALAALESVHRLNPLIELVGLLPTMFDPTQETHRTCLKELLTRRPESVFTPVVPVDPGLMHRAAGQGAPEIGVPARQAYQCAADRVNRMLHPTRRGPAHAAPAGGKDTHPSAAPVAPAARPTEAVYPPAAAEPAAWAPAHPSPAPPPMPPAANGYAPPASYDPAAPPLPPGGWPSGDGVGRPTPGLPAAPQYAPAAPAAYPPQAAAPGYPPPQVPAGYPVPVGQPGYPPQTVPPGYVPQVPFPQAGQVDPAAAPGTGAESWDRDRQEPDWWQEAPGRGDRATVRRRPARAGSPATFALGFAAACILLLLAWAGGAFRRMPMAGPSPGVPKAYAVPRGDREQSEGERERRRDGAGEERFDRDSGQRRGPDPGERRDSSVGPDEENAGHAGSPRRPVAPPAPRRLRSGEERPRHSVAERSEEGHPE